MFLHDLTYIFYKKNHQYTQKNHVSVHTTNIFFINKKKIKGTFYDTKQQGRATQKNTNLLPIIDYRKI